MKQKPVCTLITSSTQYYSYMQYEIILYKQLSGWNPQVIKGGHQSQRLGTQTTAAQALAAAVEYCNGREAGTV